VHLGARYKIKNAGKMPALPTAISKTFDVRLKLSEIFALIRGERRKIF
jgi:hypothetical protein